MSALSAVERKSFNGKFTAKINLKINKNDQIFYVTISDADIESLKSPHTSFDKYLDYVLVKFEQTRMVRPIQNFELFDKKWLTIFDKVLMPVWKTFL